MAQHLRLASNNGVAVRENWRNIPAPALVTVNLPRETVDGLWHGYGNMMEAYSHMLAACNAAKAGDDDTFNRETNRAMGCLALTSAFAADVYRRVQEQSFRTNRRRSGRKEG